jgi:hypothetical protein
MDKSVPYGILPRADHAMPSSVSCMYTPQNNRKYFKWNTLINKKGGGTTTYEHCFKSAFKETFKDKDISSISSISHHLNVFMVYLNSIISEGGGSLEFMTRERVFAKLNKFFVGVKSDVALKSEDSMCTQQGTAQQFQKLQPLVRQKRSVRDEAEEPRRATKARYERYFSAEPV